MYSAKKLIGFIKTSELSSNLFRVLCLVIIFRTGSLIALPGIDIGSITKSSNGLLNMLDMFLGGAFNNVSIFGLGIMPYINASIIVHLLILMYPSFKRIQMDGQYGRARINRITKLLTLFIAIFQSVAFFGYIVQDSWLLINKRLFMCMSVFVLSAGSMMCVWIGEKITDCGIGQGMSILIMIGIVSALPRAIYDEYALKSDMLTFLLEILMFVATITFVIIISLAVRKIKLICIKETMSFEDLDRKRHYLPQKLIGSGVMPVIFAQVFMFILSFFFKFLSSKSNICSTMYGQLTNTTSLTYGIIYAVIIVMFSYLYLAVNINPMKIAEDLKRGSEFIPGIKPGEPTAKYIDRIISLIALPGALCLVIVAMLPSIMSKFGVGQSFAHFFGGTSLLILVTVVVECMRYIESYFLLFQYDNLDEFNV